MCTLRTSSRDNGRQSSFSGLLDPRCCKCSGRSARSMKSPVAVIATGAITATGDFIDLADLPEHLQHRGSRRPENEDWRPLSLDEVRKVHIQRVLELCQGNRLRAAQILGIGRTSLYRYLKRDGHEIRSREKSGGATA